VTKYFASAAEFKAELRLYRLGLPMLPRLLRYQAPAWIVMERVSGMPYMDVTGTFDAAILAETLAAFHFATYNEGNCLCHIDNQPRNILSHLDRFYFLDFSDSRREYPEYDVCHLLLFWAADFPPEVFNEKLQAFLPAYNARLAFRPVLWQECLSRSIESFDQRRELYHKTSGRNPLKAVEQNRKKLFNSV